MSQDSLLSTLSSHQLRSASLGQSRDQLTSNPFPRLEPSNPSPISDERRGNPYDGYLSEAEEVEKAATPQKEDDQAVENGHTTMHLSVKGENGTDRSERFTEGPEGMPIELVSLSDRFIDSLSAKVHPSPPTIEKLSALFQDFYLTASSHISTHIALISSRQYRDVSPSSMTSRNSSFSRSGARKVAASVKDRPHRASDASLSEQQMLTATEIADRKRARVQLEKQRRVLEEAIEQRVCEAVYDRIWRHRSTQDEERDEKLRSRTAALAVVGIGLADLGVEVKPTGGDHFISEDDIREQLGVARDELLRMNSEKHPLGKLLHLKSAHKCIVDTLSRLHPSSSSADEILPTLIFTLITTRPEGIDVISNLSFIQRFRTASKIDGEAAYCLTNLEAAISFLENVDIASLRADEASTRPSKSTDSRPSLTVEKSPFSSDDSGLIPSNHLPISDLVASEAQPENQPVNIRPTSLHQQRPSHVSHPSTGAIGAASDAFKNGADQGFKTIGNTLEFSYKLLFGRLRERQLNGDGETDGEPLLVVPKTLDEARKLVGTPLPADEDLPSSSNTASEQPDVPSGKPNNDRFLSFFGGAKMAREKSSDSVKSGGSGKKVSFVEGEITGKHHQQRSSPSAAGISTSNVPATVPASASPLGPAVESMRNLGNTLNPLNRFAGMNAMLSFGRSVSSPSTTTTTGSTQAAAHFSSPSSSREKKQMEPLVESATGTSSDKTSPPGATATDKVKQELVDQEESQKAVIAPPITKFMEMENAGDLKISEVLELLRDYRRIAGVLKDLKLV
ncbi:MAG: hypothetical protein M1816_001069 [Peltula sp. TS41687]|nr:MAG: hypothetical protein M1816_001069 [Peltula sp. TS41687]